MVQTVAATAVTISDLESWCGIQLIEDEQFFREWLDDLPDLTESEKFLLERVKPEYLNILKYSSMLETSVKMVVLSPLLEMAGFYLPPFYIETEPSIELELVDGEVIIKGRIDVLVLDKTFWILVIESKRVGVSLEEGEAQMLKYLLSNPDKQVPSYGLLTNGTNFQFMKLTQVDTPQYAFSRLFNLRNPGNDLYGVLRVLKRLAQILRNRLK